jgi:2,3-bisphosphoglycerate-independent phosphoglycerate mutase
MTWTLDELPGAPRRPGPVLVVVLDGVGIGRRDEGDAVHLARTPVLDRLAATCPSLALAAHGTAVGMPSDKDMGNSEVGHNALGSGRVFDQGAKLVDGAVTSGALFDGEVWRQAMGRCADGGALHLIGLLSDGNVHSHIDHLLAMIARADRDGAARLFVHPLLDGRDVAATSALEYVDRIEAALGPIAGRGDRRYLVASGGGRMRVTMDRYEADWSVVERGWRAHVLGDARTFGSTTEAIETYRAETPGLTDQFLPPFVVADADGPVGRIEDGDAVVFFNFRGDRALEISRAFEAEDFPHFDRVRRPDVMYAGMMEYDGDLHVPSRYLVEPPAIDRTLGAYLAHNGVPQLAAAETQKFGHVTYFWNGNCSGLYDVRENRFAPVATEAVDGDGYRAHVARSTLETYLEITSDRLSFERRPWMKAAELTDAVVDELRGGHHRFVRVNYANADMVGHTGDREAAIVSMTTVDLCLGWLLEEIARLDGLALITADHGNADEMYTLDKKTGDFSRDETGRIRPKTSHTLNPVPLYLFDPRGAGGLDLDETVESPGLSNVAATILGLLGYGAPADYDPSLLKMD